MARAERPNLKHSEQLRFMLFLYAAMLNSYPLTFEKIRIIIDGELKVKKRTWGHLNNIQLGRYAEYFVKMELTLYGVETYSSEVDDRGIDFIAKTSTSRYYDFQVKSVRNLNYIFFPKSKFSLRDNLIASVVLFMDGQEPSLHLIPSLFWQNPNQLLVSRDYEGKKSEPEWGINLSRKNLNLLEPFKIEQMIDMIK